MKITIFGAAGDVGSRITSEALARGHNVTAVLRNPDQTARLPDGATAHIADIGQAGAAANAAAGSDLLISALRPPEGQEQLLVPLTRAVLDGATQTQARVLIVGGAAVLKLPDHSGHTVLSAPGFLPTSVVPIAQACAAQYRMCVSWHQANWTYICPPAMLEPGVRSGRYRTGTDTLVVDDNGMSRISMEDFAVAILDEADHPAFSGTRFTAAY